MGGGTTRTGERTRTRDRSTTKALSLGEGASPRPDPRATATQTGSTPGCDGLANDKRAPMHQDTSVMASRPPSTHGTGGWDHTKLLCEAGGAELFALENCTNVSPRETFVLVKITLEAACERRCVHGIARARGMGLRTCTNVSPRETFVLVKTRPSHKWPSEL